MRTCIAVISLLALAACQRETPSVESSAVSMEAPAATESIESTRPTANAPTPMSAEQLLANRVPAKLCNIEGIGDASFAANEIEVAGMAPVLVRGWVGMDASKTVPASAAVRIVSAVDQTKAWEIVIRVNSPRDDVATAKNAPGLAQSGFGAAVDLSGLPADSYHLFITYSSEGQNFFCDNGRVIKLNQ